MATAIAVPTRRSFRDWILEGQYPPKKHTKESHKTHSWWQVMCLTGVDYFSTLGYQPGIAALAAGLLAPFATAVLIGVTLLCALPIYRRVARESPHGQGSISMLEKLLPWWQGKLFVLCLLGFVATDFVITITLSASDATAHILENSYVQTFASTNGWNIHNMIWPIGITMVLVSLLGGVFLKGFKEAIGIAVVLVLSYLGLNAIVIGAGLLRIAFHPELMRQWTFSLTRIYPDPMAILGISLLVFPRLALGLSGFETGVAVMPLVRGYDSDTEERPEGRIRNTQKLLTVAALIMSTMLMTSSLVTTILIPHDAFLPGGPANGRALAFLAHELLGPVFGTLYDIDTIAILWFAGASAMAGLLAIIPRYLPYYGMAPEWARAHRPLVVVFMIISFFIVWIFGANVDAQGGAYATGVLVLMTSAAIAVTLLVIRQWEKLEVGIFTVVSLIFAYTTLMNMHERPDGLKIASFFIGAIIFSSLFSRLFRSLELRAETFDIDEQAKSILEQAKQNGGIRYVTIRPREEWNLKLYADKEKETREKFNIPASDLFIFIKVVVTDSSIFAQDIIVKGKQEGAYKILYIEGPAVPNSIAAFLFYTRDMLKKIPACYLSWTEGNPFKYLARFILFGEGDTGPVLHLIVQNNEPNPELRPGVYVGG